MMARRAERAKHVSLVLRLDDSPVGGDSIEAEPSHLAEVSNCVHDLIDCGELVNLELWNERLRELVDRDEALIGNGRELDGIASLDGGVSCEAEFNGVVEPRL